ncbi:hypothetical protein Droror1_Dr00012383 [Drosera rotundifolia]
MNCFMLLLLIFSFKCLSDLARANATTCRSFCGNLTIDYPFSLQYGCGHLRFQDRLYCINDVLMLHISSGSYRVLDIDYAYQSLTLHEPHLSTCNSLVLGGRGNGFMIEPSLAPYLSPVPDNVFLLIGCLAQSPLFQGFPGKHLPCRNVSDMGCEDYFRCSAWGSIGPENVGSVLGSGPMDCCAVSFGAIKAINLTRLECQGYSSAYSLAPLRVEAREWSFGIRVKYSVKGSDAFCEACEATGGTCGYGGDGDRELCLCGSWNSTATCDSAEVSSVGVMWSIANMGYGFVVLTVLLTIVHLME